MLSSELYVKPKEEGKNTPKYLNRFQYFPKFDKFLRFTDSFFYNLTQ